MTENLDVLGARRAAGYSLGHADDAREVTDGLAPAPVPSGCRRVGWRRPGEVAYRAEGADPSADDEGDDRADAVAGRLAAAG
jgi:hypothetical protein